MAKFYGYVCDEWGNKGAATRCGSGGMTAAAQSYDGSVAVDIAYRQDGKLRVELTVYEGSAHSGGNYVAKWYGTLEELVNLIS